MIVLKYFNYGVKNWDSQCGTYNSCLNKVFGVPFKFTIQLPKPNIYPQILQRDHYGRILNSKFAQVIY